MFSGSFAGADSASDLKDKYAETKIHLTDNVYGIPMKLESSSEKNIMRGDVYGIFNHPFTTVSRSLSSLTNWCEIIPQHLNIKACTYEYVDSHCKLSFYSGRKFYEKADETYQFNYDFTVKVLNEQFFNTTLESSSGPLGTKDYIFSVEAIPLADGSTFFHLGYEYKYGFMARIAMSTYLSTIGLTKVGFTVEENDENNKPVYIGGIRGVIERNAVRYYFAILSFLDTQKVMESDRFAARISHWFDLTERYHQQLYELDKNDYLKYKNMERQDQLRLQQDIFKQVKIADTLSTPEITCKSVE
jgi:hypothetical protein